MYHIFRNAGFGETKAWAETRNVMNGYGLSSIREEMISASDSWKLGRCQRIRYLFPKATLVEYMLFKLHMLELYGK